MAVIVFCGTIDQRTLRFKDGELHLIGSARARMRGRQFARKALAACQAMGFTSAVGFSGCDGAFCGAVGSMSAP